MLTIFPPLPWAIRTRPTQVRDRALRHEEHRTQIETERAVPAFRCDRFDGLPDHDRGRIHDDVEPLERACRLIREPARRHRIAQIGLEQLGAAPRLPDGPGRLFGALRRAVVMHRDITARVREPDRNRLPNAAACPGDERSRAVQAH